MRNHRTIPADRLIETIGVLEHVGAVPWWQYIATGSSLDVAIAIARQLAAAANVRAWFRPDETGDYTEIPIRPPDDSV